ncbi:serine/threonine-protein kinase [Bradyrhizobium sp. 26S5]|uniref:serine/threonine-protein kinase n=1 Tax=Bradyrhizobium sp. 26S5 TaxID=3139729 RepID=UPI0030D49517
MSIVNLSDQWTLGVQIGGGGFGKVYEATNADGKNAVIKLVPEAPGAERELLFVNLDGARYVVPILDSGEYEDSTNQTQYWAFLMPRAQKSLRDHLLANGTLQPLDAISILLDIAATLSDLDGKVVHRDLKPENVLLLDGHWCLADFGISRYAEATTAPDTRKYAFSPAYAAPERWRMERATGAADVYALGLIAFEMLDGALPFGGPFTEDYREQHLDSDVPRLKSGAAGIRALVAEMLFKSPGARPSPANLLARLEGSKQQQGSGGLAKLAEAHLHEVVRQGESERLEFQELKVRETRAGLWAAGSSILRGVQEELLQAVRDTAPSAKTTYYNQKNGITIYLGSAKLELAAVNRTQINPWLWEAPAFDVVAHSGVILSRVTPDDHGYLGRSHSLWYCDAFERDRFEWVEMAFMMTPLSRQTNPYSPFLAEPGQISAQALWNGLAEFQLAWPIERLDPEEFTDRWASWLGDAAQGKLHMPSSMPERETPRNWRQK